MDRRDVPRYAAGVNPDPDADDLYTRLGCPPGSTRDVLRAAYRRLARQLHPDRNPDPAAAARFRAVAEAWAVLGDPERRSRYDRACGTRSASLPKPWLDHFHTAVDRAERWVRGAVLPHLATHHRGDGVELAIRLLLEMEHLRQPRALSPGPRWRVWALERQSRRIHVRIDDRPRRSFARLDGGAGRTTIVLHPRAIHREGITDPYLLDDLMVQLLLSRFALALGAWRVPAALLDQPQEAIRWARQLDDRAIRQRRNTWVIRLLVAGALGLLLCSGYHRW